MLVAESLVASLTIKDIPPDLLEQLKKRAEAQRRSLTQEIIVVLSDAVTQSSDSFARGRDEQVAAWRSLAGRWQSDVSVEDEVSALLSARTAGRKVDF